MEDPDWRLSLRMQVESLAKRNEQFRSAATTASARRKTMDMARRIVRLRELLSVDPMEAAKYYMECLWILDEMERGNRGLDSSASTYKYAATDSISSVDGPLSVPPPSESAPPPPKRRWWSRISGAIETRHRQRNGDVVRDLWKSQVQFFLSSLGFIVGVGNTLRFPAKVYQHGGGVFFIPYVVCLLCFGLPIVFMHLAIGQYSGLSAAGAFKKLMPIAEGIGWALVLLAVPVSIYYNMIVAWSTYYFWYSFRGFLSGMGLPWDSCQTEWITNYNCCDLHNLHKCFNSTTDAITAPEAFFHYEVLNRPPNGVFEMGPIQDHLVVALAVAWIFVFIGVFKGIGSIGWTVSVTATVPYLLLTILFLRGTSLPGAQKGLAFLFTPDLAKLWSLPMWKSAAEQVFYELGIDAGPLISMASFSRYRNNIYRDAVLLVVFDAVTSLLCGMVIFSFIGFLAEMSGSEVDAVLQHDPLYLAFTVYPGVTSFMHAGALWAALFFAMLALSALDAEFAWLEMIASSVMQWLGSRNKLLENRILAGLCLLFFVCGLPLCARGGIFIFHSIESLNANWNSFSLGLVQIALICYAYGIDNFLCDIGSMLRLPPAPLIAGNKWKQIKFFFGPTGGYIRWCWSLVCPCILTALLIGSAANYERVTIDKLRLPWGYEVIAWLAMVGPLLIIPVSIIRLIHKTRKEGMSLFTLFSTDDWTQQHEETIPDAHRPAPSGKDRPAQRENTYMYIDPSSRNPSTRSRLSRVVQDYEYGKRGGRIADWQTPDLSRVDLSDVVEDVVEENASEEAYGRQPGRLADWQASQTRLSSQSASQSSSLHRSESIPMQPLSVHGASRNASPGPSLSASHNSTASMGLFGPPPVSPFPAATIDAPVIKTRGSGQRRRLFDEDVPFNLTIAVRAPSSHAKSLPPVRVETAGEEEEAQSASPASRSLPPILHAPATREQRSVSEDRRASTDSESDSENEGRPNRPTVIRRFRSTDSFTADSMASISITPIDMVRQRSLSSLAIYDQSTEQRRAGKSLSLLKRPQPISAPPQSQ